MNNKYLKEILIFGFALTCLTVFFLTSKSNSTPNAGVSIKLNKNVSEIKEIKLKNDLKLISSVSNVDISNDTDIIVLEVDNQLFDSIPVEKTLDKWEVDYEKDFDIYIIADALEY